MSCTGALDIINNAVCRTCLQTGHLTSLDDACCAAMCLGEMLTLCTRVKMPVANDGLPTHICQDCLCELKQAYKFVLKCRKSDDKLRSRLNKNINTSAVVQISRRNYGITHTEKICVKTEVAANINATNDLNANVKLEADLKLGISDLSMKQKTVKTLEDGRCSEDDFKSLSLNDSFECINDFKISQREPLPISAIQTDLDQELDQLKHEINCDVKTEKQHYMNYRNENIDVNRASVYLHENATEPKLCRQSPKLLPEKETKNKIISVRTKAKNALSVHTEEITLNQSENAMNMMNAVVILEDINVHLKSLKSPTQHQFEQLNSAVSKSINKIAVIAETSSTRHKIGQIRRNRRASNINYTKMSVKPVTSYKVKPKSERRAINTNEESSKSPTSRIRRHQVPYTCKFTCTVCEKSFTNKRKLRGHAMKHTGESLHPPDGIVKSTTRNEGGTRHVLKHMGKKSFVCNMCEKAFSGKTGIKLHLLTHTGEKPFSCEVCDKTFTQRGHLTRHMLIHTGEKPYSCATCDKTFARRGILTKHKLTHTGEKPYSCTSCTKTFNQKGDLARHMLIHTGEKPFSCATCDKTFTRKGHLTRHVETHRK